MTILKIGKSALTLATATVFAIGIAASAPTAANAASKTGNFFLGAAAGAAGLALLHNLNKNRRYNRRYYRPATRRYYYAPAAWTPAWYSYCARKYRSFNPNTGYYRAYSGRSRFCR